MLLAPKEAFLIRLRELGEHTKAAATIALCQEDEVCIVAHSSLSDVSMLNSTWQ